MSGIFRLAGRGLNLLRWTGWTGWPVDGAVGRERDRFAAAVSRGCWMPAFAGKTEGDSDDGGQGRREGDRDGGRSGAVGGRHGYGGRRDGSLTAVLEERSAETAQASRTPRECPRCGTPVAISANALRRLKCRSAGVAGTTKAPGLVIPLRGALIVENDQVPLRGFVALHDVPSEEQALVQGSQGVEAG